MIKMGQDFMQIIDFYPAAQPVWPDLAIYWTLGNFLKTFNLPKSSTFLSNFCIGDKIYHCSSEIIFGQLLYTYGDFFLVTLSTMYKVKWCWTSVAHHWLSFLKNKVFKFKFANTFLHNRIKLLFFKKITC